MCGLLYLFRITHNPKNDDPNFFRGVPPLSLSRNARKAARSVPIEDLKKDNGIDLMIVELDKYYSCDEGRRQMKAFDEFINFRRSEGMSVRDFLLQFELKHNACKTMKMDIPDNILAHSMLACANLPPDKKDIVSSCLTSFTSTNVREQIIKIFPNGVNNWNFCW